MKTNDNVTAERPTFVTHLECSMTGERYEADRLHNLSEGGWPLLVRYDLDAVRGALTKDSLSARPTDLWRWRELLPVRRADNVVSLGETATPIVPLPATGAGPDGSSDWHWDWDHVQYLILPAVTMSFIPMGIIARTVRALVAETLSQEFMTGLRARGLTGTSLLRHVVKNCAPTALAVMGLQLGYLLGGSILIETVFSWPVTGFLLNAAIFQRDLPLLQGTILILALFFVVLNLLADILQTVFDPRIERS